MRPKHRLRHYLMVWLTTALLLEGNCKSLRFGMFNALSTDPNSNSTQNVLNKLIQAHDIFYAYGKPAQIIKYIRQPGPLNIPKSGPVLFYKPDAIELLSQYEQITDIGGFRFPPNMAKFQMKDNPRHTFAIVAVRFPAPPMNDAMAISKLVTEIQIFENDSNYPVAVLCRKHTVSTTTIARIDGVPLKFVAEFGQLHRWAAVVVFGRMKSAITETHVVDISTHLPGNNRPFGFDMEPAFIGGLYTPNYITRFITLEVLLEEEQAGLIPIQPLPGSSNFPISDQSQRRLLPLSQDRAHQPRQPIQLMKAAFPSPSSHPTFPPYFQHPLRMGPRRPEDTQRDHYGFSGNPIQVASSSHSMPVFPGTSNSLWQQSVDYSNPSRRLQYQDTPRNPYQTMPDFTPPYGYPLSTQLQNQPMNSNPITGSFIPVESQQLGQIAASGFGSNVPERQTGPQMPYIASTEFSHNSFAPAVGRPSWVYPGPYQNTLHSPARLPLPSYSGQQQSETMFVNSEGMSYHPMPQSAWPQRHTVGMQTSFSHHTGNTLQHAGVPQADAGYSLQTPQMELEQGAVSPQHAVDWEHYTPPGQQTHLRDLLPSQIHNLTDSIKPPYEMTFNDTLSKLVQEADAFERILKDRKMRT